MIDLKEKIENLLGTNKNAPISWVYLNTAEPKYLVFEKDKKFPKYVVQVGPLEPLNHTYKNLTGLWSLIPGLVPEPIACIELETETAMFVQTGVPGIPWFTLRNHYRTPVDLESLNTRIIHALSEFHHAVSKKPSWKQELSFVGELERLSSSYKNLKPAPIPSNFDTIVDQQIGHLQEISKLECHFQHGDFCINNTLVSKNKIAIIDFEHFGQCSMPYHDEFLLASSLLNFGSDHTDNICYEIWQKVSDRSKYRQEFTDRHLPGLFLCHILWWILETNDKVARKERRDHYTKLLQVFCKNEESQLGWRPNLYLVS